MFRKMMIVSALLASTSAYAQGSLGRSLPLNQPLVDVHGNAMHDPVSRKPGETDADYKARAEKEQGPIATLGEIAAMAFLATIDADRTAAPKDKYDNWKLMDKIANHPDQFFISDEVTKIKDRIGHVYGAGVVGPAWQLLDAQPKASVVPGK